jgi:hypothetical protein
MGRDYEYEYVNDIGYVQRLNGVYGSVGSGFSSTIAIGGVFGHGMFGYDVAFSYLLGKKYTFTTEYIATDYDSKAEHVNYARSFQFAPSISFSTGAGKFQPLARFGPVLAMTTITDEFSAVYEAGSEMTEVYKFKGGISFGFKGAIGVTYGITESLKLFTELNFMAMSYSPKERELIEYTVNGENQIDDVDPENRTIDLEKEYETENQEGEPPLREPYAMSSWGLQAGVIFYLKK